MTLPLQFESDSIPFITAEVQVADYLSQQWRLMIDTGSSHTAFNVDLMTDIGVVADPADIVVMMFGVGGRETILERSFGSLRIGDYVVAPFVVQRGPLDYGFILDGILGSDFLLALGLTNDYGRGELRKDA